MRFVDTSRVRSSFDEPIVARDGTRLSADVYLPPAPGRYPVLITRTPYDNNRLGGFGAVAAFEGTRGATVKKLAACGFIVVAGDVRGRGDSDGRFVPFVHEAEDGADTVEWARSLPEADGRVGLFGAGYGGFAARAAAAAAAVDALALWSPFGADGLPFRGGAVRLEWLFWMHLVGGRTPQPADVPPWRRILAHRPIVSMHEALGREDAPWAEWLAGSSDLEALEVAEPRGPAAVPTLFVSGWWDSGLGGTVRQWESARAGKGGELAALVVGPWDTPAVRRPVADSGGVPWGPRAALDPDELLLRWFGAHLGDGEPPVRGARIFVTGANEWSEGARFPPPEPELRTLWLASGGRANTRLGDGRLSDRAAGDGQPDRFVHDPERPVHWQPEFRAFSRSEPPLTLDTGFLTTRDDVLVYDSAPLTAPLSVRGAPLARLWAQSSGEDADWIVALEDVFPLDGQSIHLTHGIVRMGAVRERGEGSPRECVVELAPIAHDFLPGHSLRVVVGSSLWPLYPVNLGGPDYLRDTAPRRCENVVFHEAGAPSRIELPLDSLRPCDLMELS